MKNIASMKVTGFTSRKIFKSMKCLNQCGRGSRFIQIDIASLVQIIAIEWCSAFGGCNSQADEIIRCFDCSERNFLRQFATKNKVAAYSVMKFLRPVLAARLLGALSNISCSGIITKLSEEC